MNEFDKGGGVDDFGDETVELAREPRNPILGNIISIWIKRRKKEGERRTGLMARFVMRR